MCEESEVFLFVACLVRSAFVTWSFEPTRRATIVGYLHNVIPDPLEGHAA